RLVFFPVIVIIIEDESAHRACAIISWLACTLTIPEILHNGARPRVEQGFVGIEAKAALLGIAGTVKTPVVVHTGRQSLNIDVPAIERPMVDGIEADHLKRCRAPRLFVQQQLSARRPLTPDRKINALGIYGGPERIPPPWLNLVGLHIPAPYLNRNVRKYPRAWALPRHALSGRLCLRLLLPRQSRSTLAFPGRAWEREERL